MTDRHGTVLVSPYLWGAHLICSLDFGPSVAAEDAGAIVGGLVAHLRSDPRFEVFDTPADQARLTTRRVALARMSRHPTAVVNHRLSLDIEGRVDHRVPAGRIASARLIVARLRAGGYRVSPWRLLDSVYADRYRGDEPPIMSGGSMWGFTERADTDALCALLADLGPELAGPSHRAALAARPGLTARLARMRQVAP